MDKYNLLDCTLRDGGYINNWEFGTNTIMEMLQDSTEAGADYIEVGYLNSHNKKKGAAIYNTIEEVKNVLPSEKKNTIYLAMADVNQFYPSDITPYTGESIEGIRVVFYKHQVEEALALCEAVKKNGYKLFVQPMVTIDYSLEEYATLLKKIAVYHPYAVAIVDSFGYMMQSEFRTFFNILDSTLPIEASIGFHSHNNLQLSFLVAQDIFTYDTDRKLIIDATLLGMGRGAGNLNLELIANYYNRSYKDKYDVEQIIDMIGKYIMPIREKKYWGYDPYFYLTGLYHCHPNFASYLLEIEKVTVQEFRQFLKMIPQEMRTKCRREYVKQLYEEFKRIKDENEKNCGDYAY